MIKKIYNRFFEGDGDVYTTYFFIFNLGNNIFYVEGIISNNGTQIIKRIDLTFLFKNSSNQIVFQETRKALQYRGEKGIQPKNQANFQVAFENLPEDWNYLIPKVQIARITFHY